MKNRVRTLAVSTILALVALVLVPSTAQANGGPYNLSVTKSGTGTGMVKNADGTIHCGTYCSFAFSALTVVTLTATPAAVDSYFAGWTGDCSGTSTCVVTMDAAKSVNAIFTSNPLAVTKSGTGTGRVQNADGTIYCGTYCSSGVAPATVVTLTASPAAGSFFTGWDYGSCGASLTCAVTMPASGGLTVDASFGVNPALTVTKLGDGAGKVKNAAGTIYCGIYCSYAFPVATVVTLTASPAVGSYFAGWIGDCIGTSTCVVTMDAAKSVNAIFNSNPLTVTKDGTGTGKVKNADGTIHCGLYCVFGFAPTTVVTLTAVPAAGSFFTGWDYGSCGASLTCAVTMPAFGGQPITATFSATPPVVTYALSATKSGDGTGRVQNAAGTIYCGIYCSYSFAPATVVTLTAAPAVDSYFAGWSGGGCSGTSTCVVTMDAAKSVDAVFNYNPLTVTKDGSGTGMVKNADGTIHCGTYCLYGFAPTTVVTLTAAPAEGSTFTGWSYGECGASLTCAVTMPASGGQPVTATFDSAG